MYVDVVAGVELDYLARTERLHGESLCLGIETYDSARNRRD